MHTTTTAEVRQGHRWRSVSGSWLAVDVDLDRAQPVAVATDIDALSRAVEALARSGGFALALDGEGGPCADAQLVVEDCGYELGAALREAIGGTTRAPRGTGRAAFGSARAAAELEFAGPPGADCGGIGPGPAGAMPVGLVPAFFRAFAFGIGARVAVTADGGTVEERLAAGCAGVGKALAEAIGGAGQRRPERVSRP